MPVEYVFFLVALAGGALVCLYLFWMYSHRVRLVEDTPTSRVRSAAQGFVEIEGWGEPPGEEMLRAPLSGEPCLWYRYAIHKRTERGNRPSWGHIDSGESHAPILLRDSTGTVLVELHGAEIRAGARQTWYGETPWPTQEPQAGNWAAMLDSNAGDKYRYQEQRIMPGPLYVMGWFNTTSHHATSVEDLARGILRRWKEDQAGLKERFDANGDGEIDPEEWDQAREAAMQEAVERRLTGEDGSVIDYISRPPHRHIPFVIANDVQEYVVNRYRYYSWGYLVAFLVLLAGFGAAFFTR